MKQELDNSKERCRQSEKKLNFVLNKETRQDPSLAKDEESEHHIEHLNLKLDKLEVQIVDLTRAMWEP